MGAVDVNPRQPANVRAVMVAEIRQQDWARRGRPSVNPPPGRVLSTDDMAQEAGVGTRTMERARKAVREGHASAVKDGSMSLKDAASERPRRSPEPAAQPPIDEDAQRIADLESEVRYLRAFAPSSTEQDADFKRLRGEIRVVEASRDTWMRKANELGPVHANAPNYVVNLQIVQQNNASTSSIRGLSSHLHSP